MITIYWDNRSVDIDQEMIKGDAALPSVALKLMGILWAIETGRWELYGFGDMAQTDLCRYMMAGIKQAVDITMRSTEDLAVIQGLWLS